MAIAQEPNKWSMPLGANADANTIPDTAPEYTGAASMNSVFPQITQVPLEAGGIAPTRADFNGLFKLLGDSIYYIQRGGIFSYADTVDYPAGAVVKSSNGIYIAIQANGPASTVAGPANANYWRRLTTTVNNQYADANGNISITSVANATNATNCPNYLPLVGGTVTGSITSTTGSGGASLKSGNHQIYMIDADPQSIGQFIIRSMHAGTFRDFVLKADGSITWGGSNVECVSEKGNEYIRYSNGLQICWGTKSTNAGFAFPKPFNSRPSVTATSINGERLVCVQTAVNTSGATIMQWTDGTPSWITGKFCDYIAVGTWK